jgi:CYTH domain-containing protein
MGGGAGEFIETERKYEVGPDFALPDLTGLESVAAVSPPQTHQLSAVYFDTADLRLAAARITLRRRTGGTDAGWHLKLPAGAQSRREVHAALGEATAEVPAALAGKVSAWTGGQPLQPIAQLDTTRVVHHLTGPGDQVLAEIADDLVTGLLPAPDAAGTGVAAPEDAGPAGAGAQGQPRWQQASRWREVEVELAAGPRGLLDVVGERLLQAGATPSAAASKLSRLLAARQG